MQSGIVAVWDPDRSYAEKLGEYLRRQGGFGTSVVSFGDLQRLRKMVEHRQVAVIVAHSEAEDKEWLQGIPSLFLTETPSMSRASPGRARPMYFYKYQPAGQILPALSAIQKQTMPPLSADVDALSVGQQARQPARIRGIYSPMGGCLKTSLGLVMGCLLAEDRRCLFLSLEAHAGFRTLFGRQYPVDLADLFALVRQGGNLLGALTEAMQPFGKLRYIPPVIWPVDIREAEFAELKELLQRLALCGHFDEIIVDVGQDLARPEKILMLCDHIYQPTKEDVFSQAKLAEYDCYLRVSGYEGLLARTQKIPLSQLTAGLETSQLDQWQRWEQMIPVVRQILEEAKDEGES